MRARGGCAPRVCSGQMSCHFAWRPPEGAWAGWAAPGPLTAALPLSQVRALEHRNQLLETRWRFLQSRDSAAFDLGHLYEEHQGRLREKLREVNQEGGQLETKLRQELETVKAFQIR